MNTATRKGQSGFTLVELSLTAAMLGGAIAMISMCLETAARSLSADDLVARSMESLQRSAVRVSSIMRPCSISTYRIEANAADVGAGLAAAAGEWLEPNDGEARPAIQFRSASGIESMNAATLTAPRMLRLLLEPTELDNDVDDDGDGLIDEGDLALDYDGILVRLATKVESVTFTLTTRLLTIRMQSAARRRDGNVQRFTISETLYLRNN